MKEIRHIPVMVNEVLEYLVPDSGGGRFIDCTVGLGGHAEAVLNKNSKIEVLGIDQDYEAITIASERLSSFGERVHLVHGKFSEVAEIMRNSCDWESGDFFLLDLGVSSPQIDRYERGFSYRFKGPLDMRMDRKSNKTTAARILNSYGLEDLIRIFRNYGEIRGAKKLAEAIVERREKRPWLDTEELADLCERVIPSRRHKSRMPSATLCFMALRIAVNRELDELNESLSKIITLMERGGRVGVISYHSLEDRIVKELFKREASNCICPPEFPKCICKHKPKIKIITKKPISPLLREIVDNKRSRSAKFRVAEKL